MKAFRSSRFPFAVAFVAGAFLVALVRTGGTPAGSAVPVAVPVAIPATGPMAPHPASRPAVDDLFAGLAPKSTLRVVKGEKAVAPAVPAPVTRAENRIVEYELTVRETSARIAPDLTYTSLWTFDGVAPGPVMRVKVGDVVRFTLRNDGHSVTNHNIDFHFMSGACGGCCDTGVKPGEARTIEVRALYPGVFMYHCAYKHEGNIAAVHIANGMYGFLIVDPRTPLPAVDHEFMLIEGEFYVDRTGKSSGTCSLQDLASETPTYVFINGKSSELTPPLTVGTNQRVRLYVGRGGVNGSCAFHVIGAIFDKVYQDGSTLDAPAGHGVQTVTVPAGGATVVEFVTPVPGTLTAVDHNLSRVFFKGLGQVINVEGPANPEIYEPLAPNGTNGGQPHRAAHAGEISAMPTE
jgi:nitrite reductase (NO-forming)